MHFSENAFCPELTYKCRTSFCVSIELRCNGVADCPDGDDELMCTAEQYDLTGKGKARLFCAVNTLQLRKFCCLFHVEAL